MNPLNIRQSVEFFHLIMLDQIGRKLDKSKWTLKGGCNFRFFFRSPRYSDDMDLDIRDIPAEKLREKFNSILSARTSKTILEIRRISIDHITEHKQTETTQRWKFGLNIPGSSQPIPTKIEFSRRGLEGGSVFEPVLPEIIGLYELPPVMANHYPASIAAHQKIGAILARSTTQARDIFDLNLLLDAGLLANTALAGTRQEDAARVRENILAVDFGQFKSQVLSFLESDLCSRYDSEDLWDRIRLRIIEALNEEAP